MAGLFFKCLLTLSVVRKWRRVFRIFSWRHLFFQLKRGGRDIFHQIEFDWGDNFCFMDFCVRVFPKLFYKKLFTLSNWSKQKFREPHFVIFVCNAKIVFFFSLNPKKGVCITVRCVDQTIWGRGLAETEFFCFFLREEFIIPKWIRSSRVKFLLKRKPLASRSKQVGDENAKHFCGGGENQAQQLGWRFSFLFSWISSIQKKKNKKDWRARYSNFCDF